MVAKKTTLKEVAEMLAHVVEHMATKDDLAALGDELRAEFKNNLTEFRVELKSEMREGFASIREELRDIRQRLEALEEAARNSAGLTKEIDHLMERVRAIEKHLGMEPKIAA